MIFRNFTSEYDISSESSFSNYVVKNHAIFHRGILIVSCRARVLIMQLDVHVRILIRCILWFKK